MMVSLSMHICVTRPSWVKTYLCNISEYQAEVLMVLTFCDGQHYCLCLCRVGPESWQQNIELRRMLWFRSNAFNDSTLPIATIIWLIASTPDMLSDNIRQMTTKVRSLSALMSPDPMKNVTINTLRPIQNGRHFADDIFKCIFLNENVWIPIKISLKFVPKGTINNIPALVQTMGWRRPGDKPLSEPIMVSLPTHICVTRP